MALGIDERAVLMASKRTRVVGRGLEGYGIELTVEVGMQNAMRETSWSAPGRSYRFDRNGNLRTPEPSTLSETEQALAMSLYDTIEELGSVRQRLSNLEEDL